MTRLLVITRPELIAGFHLSGVDAYRAEDPESAQELIQAWMENGEAGLLAIDDGLFEKLEPSFLRRLEAYEAMPHLTIPGGRPLGPEASRKYRITEMIRRAVGVQITFKGEAAPGEEK
jgi:vacuolar-type H+-ATPase subunit F/Vma7